MANQINQCVFLKAIARLLVLIIQVYINKLSQLVLQVWNQSMFYYLDTLKCWHICFYHV